MTDDKFNELIEELEANGVDPIIELLRAIGELRKENNELRLKLVTQHNHRSVKEGTQ